MFVRWKTKCWTTSAGRWGNKPIEARAGLYAVLVASERRDGVPRQRVVKHLGGIPTHNLGDEWARASFWRSVEQNLAALSLSPDVVARICARLAARVPQVTSPQETARSRKSVKHLSAAAGK